MGLQQNLQKAIDQFAALQKAGAGISTGTGLVFYDLEARAKFQYPVLAPFRQHTPRIGATNPLGGQGLAAHWNAILSPNANNVPAEAAEGQSGALLIPTVAQKIATYKLLALDNVVTWQSEWSGYGYEDVRSAAQRMTLDAMILQEEPRLLWGNSGTTGVGLNFGQPATPTGTGSATGGSLATGTYYVAVAALTYQGWVFATNQNPLAVVPQYVKSNGDGTSLTMNGGVSQVSAISAGISVTSGGSVGSVSATVTAIPGAVAYAWFAASSNSLAACFISQVTTLNVATITTVPTTGQVANYVGSGTDYSANPYSFDGAITQAVSGGGYFKSLNGAAFTADNAGGVNEINTALKYFWDQFKTSPTRMYAGSGTIQSITKIILSSGTSSSFEFRVGVDNTPGSVGGLVGSAFVSSYNNRFALGARKPIPIDIHPNMPDGHLFFDLEENPYPSSNIPYARAVRTLRDYFQVLWPPTSPVWRNSIFCAECFQIYVPYGMGLISNISNS